jgi:hypothetical protein
LRILVLGVCVFFAVKGVRAGLKPAGSDFTIYYDAGRAVLAGQDPLQVEHYIYLPVFALLMAPLALLPYTAALVVWQAASFAALVWITARCRRFADSDGKRPWLAWLPLLVCLRLVDSNLTNGQANLFVLAAIVAALAAAVSSRDGRAGAWFGAGAAAKVLPVGLLVAFALRGRIRVVATALAVLATGLVLPALVLGWRGNADALAHWWRTQPEPYLRGGNELLEAREYLPGQSLTATAYRLLTRTPSTSSADPSTTDEIVALDPDVVKWIVRAVGCACAAFLIASLAVSRRRAAEGALVREVALAMCFAVMLGPLVHKAHMVWLLLPYALLFAGTPDGVGPVARRVRWTFVGLSIAFIGLTAPALLGRYLGTWALRHNAVFFGVVCVTVALAIDVWRARSRDLSAETVPGRIDAGILRASTSSVRP